MARKPKAFDIWKEMKPAGLRRLAMAVFLLFGVFGPLTFLMESKLHIVSWSFIVIQTVASGGMAASIILFGRNRWWAIMLVIVFWGGVMVFNSGGLGIVFNNEGMKIQLNGVNASENVEKKADLSVPTPEQLNDIYTQRGIVGIAAIALLSFGYAMFIKVIHAEVRQRSRLEAEVNIAKSIQESLLPDSVLQNSWITVVGSMTPAAEVGGDVYDVIPISDDLIAVAIADVSGHGVGAGILSAMTKSALHLQLQHDASPVAVLEHLNKTLFEVSDEKTFVTFGYMLIDHAHKTIALSTAGHPPVLQFDSASKKINFHRTANIGLGMRRETSFSYLNLPFRSGDTFVLYTDGAVETADPKGEQFGIERIQEIVTDHRGSVQDLCSVMNERLKEFTAAGTFQDDVTIVCVRLL